MRKKLAILTLFCFTLFALTWTPPDSFDIQHGTVPKGERSCTRNGGCPWTVIYRVHHRPILALTPKAHAQVQNARGQAATIAYETQRFGATTATSASQYNISYSSFTWAVPFPDVNYTAVCEIAGTLTSTPGPIGTNLTSHLNTATAVVFGIIALQAAASSSTETDCVGIHD